MDPGATYRGRIHGIVPPYLLESIAKRGSEAEKKAALETLEVHNVVRNMRVERPPVPIIGHAAVPTAAPNKRRTTDDANHGLNLPGTRIRSEGQGPTGDTTVDESYEALGATFDLYWDVYHRNSIDDAGMNLDSTVRYGQSYNNAFWHPGLKRMVFGDGDGVIFSSFIGLDVVGHELSHGVIEYAVALNYDGQSGALEESLADVFGSFIKQRAQTPPQTAVDADWLIGAGLFTPQVQGVAFRSMKAPGTAYDDPRLGKDPQPDHMDGYVRTSEDYGGAHINSGIPNRAFYLAAVALGGYAWEKTGRIWYETLCDPLLKPNAQFQNFADLTIATATRLFGADAAQSVMDAWLQVGIKTQLRGSPAEPRRRS